MNYFLNEISFFINLRWLAAIGLIFFSIFFHLLKQNFEVFIVAGLYVFLVNLIFNELKNKKYTIYLQIFFDWFIIAIVSYYTGGVFSPIVYLFVFHIVIVSMLLVPMEHFLFTTLASLTVVILGMLKNQFSSEAIMNLVFLLFMFYVTGYLASRQAKKLMQAYRGLEIAHNKLKELDEHKTMFYVKTAHILKSPIATAKTLINEVVFRRVFDEEVLLKVIKKLDNAMAIIKDILKLEIIRDSDIKKSDVDIVSIFHEVLQSYSETIKEKDLKVVFNSAPIGKVKGNYEHYRIIAENILENAIKYTPQNGTIRVELGYTDDFIIIKVEDTGIGIPYNELGRVGEEFYRASNARRFAQNGTGLGIAIVKEVLKSINGSIDIKSNLDSGTSVVIKIKNA
ncbi:MAG: HAMP domain-containing histidine kinase [bacterium]|nr:HAMP domain-containing histidine kinase [bacterium]